MRIIPPSILNVQETPKSEKRVFKILKEVDICPNGFAVHSQNITGDRNRLWYEIDFVVLSRAAVIVIEVKGGEVSRGDDGIWEVRDKETGNSIYRKKESPLKQASLNARKFETEVLSRFIKYTGAINIIPCVILAGNHRTGWPSHGAPPDLPDDYTAYKEDVTREGIEKFLKQVIGKYSEGNAKKILPETLTKIRKYLRGKLDTGIAKVSDLEIEVSALTEEQYEKADFIAPASRVVIEGGAGTGKTFLALYIAREEGSKAENRVAYVTSSLCSCEELRATNLKAERGNFSIINSTELDESYNKRDKFDVLVIDEGQQLCTTENLDKLDKLLESGLENGRWRWFGDPQHQVIEKELFDEEAYGFVCNFTGNNTVLPLKKNVRNTPQIIRFIVSATGADLGEIQVQGHGPTVDIHPEKKLIKKLMSWLDYQGNGGGLSNHSEIAVLCRDKDDFPEASRLMTKAGLKTEFYNGTHKVKKATLLSTIDNFRGLESRRVIIIGLHNEPNDHELRRLLYQSVSRSKAHVIILDEDDLLGRLADLGENN